MTVHREQAVVAGAVVRVWAGAHEVVGGGFLIAPDVVATCARVVAKALDTDPFAVEPPTEPVRLDFPLVRTDNGMSPQIQATVQRWSPVGEDGSGDLALLRLTGSVPPQARMPPLRRIEQLTGHAFSALGFPPGLADGVWSTGLIRGEQGADRCQLDSAPGEQRIDAGFAGAPVWEADSGAVVGMAVPPHRGTNARLIPIDEVAGFDPELLACPYRGLRSFDEEHADIFFGRDDDIHRLLDAAQRRPVVAVAGPSGAGKSSLVRAGLLPRLRAAGAQIVYLRAEPGSGIAALETSLPEVDKRGLVLVLDQFEELAAVDPPAARRTLEQIVQLTESVTGPPVRAVLTLRWSALDELLTPELIGTLEAGTVLVGPLDRTRLGEAIVRPAERPPGLAFETGLVERILDDAGAEPGQLPLVESLLTDLWEHRDGGYLTLRGYETVGGVAGALAQHAERVVNALPPGDAGALRRLLTALARPDLGGRFIRRPVRLDQLPAAQRALVPTLTTGRLLVVSRSARGTDIVELAHQALIDHWPLLHTWLAEDREFLAWREQVSIQRERWEAETRSDTALLRGATLAAATGWLPTRKDDLPRTDLDYLQRSAVRQRRDIRRWRMITAIFAVLAIGAATLTVITIRSGDQIASQLATVNADTLGRESQARAPQDLAMAVQLALAAWREDPQSPQARTALARSYLTMQSVDTELPSLTRTAITDLVIGGDTAILVANPHVTAVTKLSGPAPRSEELPDISSDRQVALSPDGHWLANQTLDYTKIQLRNLVARTAPAALPHTSGAEAGQPRFSPGSDRLAWLLASTAQAPELRIWDLRTGTEVPHRLGPLPADTLTVWLTTDPNLVLVRTGTRGSPDTRLVVRSLVDGAEIATMPAGSGVVRGGAAVASCEPAPDGSTARATVTVTPVGSALAPMRIRARDSFCSSSFRISADGRALIEHYAGTDESGHHVLRLTDLRTGQAHQVHAPATVAAPLGLSPGFTAVSTLALAAPGDELPKAWLAHGTSLLRLRAEPSPSTAEQPAGEIMSMDDHYRLIRTQDGFATVENGTGRQLGALDAVRDRNSVSMLDGRSLWNARLAASGWDLTQYDLPALRRINSFLLPSRGGSAPAGDRRPPTIALQREHANDGGRLLAIGDGVLSAWDPRTGQSLGQLVPLGTTDLQISFYRDFPSIRARPGHPGQAAILGINAVQLWDVVQGRLLATIPATADLDALDIGDSPLEFDPAGNRLVVLARDRTVQVWDLDSLQPARAPIPAPTTTALLGFDADGYVQVLDGTLERRLVFLDLDTGAQSGSMSPAGRAENLLDDRRTVQLTNVHTGLPSTLPVTAQAWHDRLCVVANRPFTPAELAILPPGTDTDPPCS